MGRKQRCHAKYGATSLYSCSCCHNFIFLKSLLVDCTGSDEQKFLEASMAYVSGKPIMSDKEFDELKLRLKVCYFLFIDENLKLTDNRRKKRSKNTSSRLNQWLRTLSRYYNTFFFYLHQEYPQRITGD